MGFSKITYRVTFGKKRQMVSAKDTMRSTAYAVHSVSMLEASIVVVLLFLLER